MNDTHEDVSQIIGGIINDLEWLNELPDGYWYDGHGDLKNKAFEVQRTVNKLREFVGFPTSPPHDVPQTCRSIDGLVCVDQS